MPTHRYSHWINVAGQTITVIAIWTPWFAACIFCAGKQNMQLFGCLCNFANRLNKAIVAGDMMYAGHGFRIKYYVVQFELFGNLYHNRLCLISGTVWLSLNSNLIYYTYMQMSFTVANDVLKRQTITTSTRKSL